MTFPLDGYVRVSRVGGRGGDRFIAPDLQEERIRAYAEARGYTIGNVYRELDRSGTDRRRPYLRAALARVTEHASGGIIVARLDRFARSARDALTALRGIEEAGGVFISVEDGLDSSTPFGQAMMTVLLALAELELARVSDVWEMSQRKAVERGIHTASHIPIGYQRGTDRRLVPDKRVAPVIVEAFRRRADGATYGDIARLFREYGIVSSWGGTEWKAHSIDGVMGNRVYTGEARRGSYRNPSAHPPIVPMRLWIAAQFGAESRVALPFAKTLLAGLVRCGGCCHVLAGDWVTTSAARQLYAYRCRVHFAAGDCGQPTWVRAREVETLAVARLLDALKARRRREADFGALERELIAAEAAHAALIGEQRLLPARDDPRSRERLAAVEAKHAELLDLVRRDRLNRLPDVRTMRRQWPSMTQVERRKALGLVFDAIVVERGSSKEVLADRVHFIRAGEIPDYFPTRRSRGAITPFDLGIGARDSCHDAGLC